MRKALFTLITLWLAGIPGQAQAPVAIEGLFPDSGPPGTTVILKGRGFALGDDRMVWASNLPGKPAPGCVEFNGARADLKLWQDTLIVVAVPDHATSGPVRVTLGSGLAVTGNHFELTNAEGESEAAGGRRDYAFMEADETGLRPSPWYYYNGYRPLMVYPSRGWNNGWDGYGRDGCLDFFMVSGPIPSACNLYTGLDGIQFFPGDFYNDFGRRQSWWDSNVHGRPSGNGQKSDKRSYKFQE